LRRNYFDNGWVLEVSHLGFWVRIIYPAAVGYSGWIYYLTSREGKIFGRMAVSPLYSSKGEFRLYKLKGAGANGNIEGSLKIIVQIDT
jgi:hypothetical protein